MMLLRLCARLSSWACRDVMRSWDSASAGDWGRDLAMLELRLEGAVVVVVVFMLMKTGVMGG